jgi:hypothetical protein
VPVRQTQVPEQKSHFEAEHSEFKPHSAWHVASLLQNTPHPSSGGIDRSSEMVVSSGARELTSSSGPTSRHPHAITNAIAKYFMRPSYTRHRRRGLRTSRSLSPGRRTLYSPVVGRDAGRGASRSGSICAVLPVCMVRMYVGERSSLASRASR